MLPDEEVERIVKETVEKNMAVVTQRGAKGAFGPLMGIIMKDYRGRVNAEKVSKLLRQYLEKFG